MAVLAWLPTTLIPTFTINCCYSAYYTVVSLFYLVSFLRPLQRKEKADASKFSLWATSILP